MKTALILGAGIVGLSTALELASRGIEVTVLERGEAMREASWAAAGMLAAGDPENPSQLTGLARLSLTLYPGFLRRIEQLSGHRVPLRTTHTLQICSPEHHSVSGRIDLAEARRRVPGLSSTIEGSLLWLEEQSLDPRDLCRALPVAVVAAGISIHEQCCVLSVRSHAASIRVDTASSSLTADCLIVCTGAWTDHFQGFSDFSAFPPLFPRKGQMLAVRAHTPYALTHVLRSPEVYLVPRGDGRIIIGATVEDAGYDRTIDPDATTWLFEKAATLWPPLQNAAIEEVWTGLRPCTPDGLPLIGPIAPGFDSSVSAKRVWIGAGHYRNGILLAPATAKLLSDAILNPADSISSDLSNFDPARFARVPAVHP